MISIAIPAAADDGRKIDRAHYPQGTSRGYYYSANQMRPWPDTWESQRPAFIATQKPKGAYEAADSNNEPKQTENSDAFYLRRSTEAAETQAYYSVWQFYVGIGSIVIGMIAAFATAWAAWAAASAAKSAAASNEIARDTAVRELRAYVHISAARREEGMINIKIKNFGQTPAHNVRNDKSFIVHFTSDRGKINYSESEISVDMPPGQEIIDVFPINRGDAIFNSPEVILYGRIRYFTAFSEIEQITEYEMIIEPTDGPLVFSVGGIKCKQAK